jgi:hypothetical protein
MAPYKSGISALTRIVDWALTSIQYTLATPIMEGTQMGSELMRYRSRNP